MRIALLYFLLLTTITVSAQKKDVTIKVVPIIRDTINLRGYLYQSDGKPAKYFFITSSYSQAAYVYSYNVDVKIRAMTDTNGYFELHGARLYDTLTVDHQLFYGPLHYYNRGSRYMVIYLPPLKVIDITPDKPVIIARKRINPKPKAVYNPKYDASTMDFLDAHVLPRYTGADRNSNKNQYVVFADSVQAHISYPAKAIANNIEGLVKVSFTIDRNGTLAFKLLQGIGYGCDEEVINTIRNLSGWIPAIEAGRPMIVEQTISVEFKLTDK